MSEMREDGGAGSVITVMASESGRVDQILAQGMDAATLHIWDYETVKPAVQEALDTGIVMTSFFSPLGDSGIPVANAILTTENMAQAVVRQVDKGRDAARVAVEMALIKQQLA